MAEISLPHPHIQTNVMFLTAHLLKDFLNPPFFPTATTQGISKPDLDSPTRSYSCTNFSSSAQQHRPERDKPDNNILCLKTEWTLEIQDEEKACSPPTRMSMRRDRVLPAQLPCLLFLLFLPVPSALPISSPQCRIPSCRSILSSPLCLSSHHGRHLSVVFVAPEKPSLTFHYTPLVFHATFTKPSFHS